MLHLLLIVNWDRAKAAEYPIAPDALSHVVPVLLKSPEKHTTFGHAQLAYFMTVGCLDRGAQIGVHTHSDSTLGSLKSCCLLCL